MWLFSDKNRHASFQPWGLNQYKIQIIVYSTVYNTTAIMFYSNWPNVQLCYSKYHVAKFFYEQSLGDQCLSVICLSCRFFSSSFVCSFFPLPRRIILDRNTLFISSVTQEDQGAYMCVARTSLDSVTAESWLIVLGKTIFPSVPRAPCST